MIEYAKTKPYGSIEKIQSEAGYRGGSGDGWRVQKEMAGGALYDMGSYDTEVMVPGVEGLKDIRIIPAIMGSTKKGMEVKI